MPLGPRYASSGATRPLGRPSEEELRRSGVVVVAMVEVGHMGMGVDDVVVFVGVGVTHAAAPVRVGVVVVPVIVDVLVLMAARTVS